MKTWFVPPIVIPVVLLLMVAASWALRANS